MDTATGIWDSPPGHRRRVSDGGVVHRLLVHYGGSAKAADEVGVVNFGPGAGFKGSLGDTHLNQPIIPTAAQFSAG